MRELPRKRNFLVVPLASFTWFRAVAQCLFEEWRDTLLNSTPHEQPDLLPPGQLVK
jgi:hypothetical protein